MTHLHATHMPAAGSIKVRDQGYRPACLQRWCWCDALFMAPPTWLALAAATGDDKYSVFADEEFWNTHEYLFRLVPEDAPGGGLFLRDSRFFEPDEDTGQLIFWGRGNGWVYAGLTSILELLPEDHPSRSRCAPDSCNVPLLCFSLYSLAW